MAARPHLPVMFIATPRDRRNSVWTAKRPSAQVSQAVAFLPAVPRNLCPSQPLHYCLETLA